MFDSATFRNPRSRDGECDVGRLLDAMLYYERVNLILDPSFYLGIVNRLGLADAAALLNHPTLVVSLVPEMPVVHTQSGGGTEFHSPTYIQFAGKEGKILRTDDVFGQIHFQIRRLPRFENVKRSDVRKTVKKASRTTLQSVLGGEYPTELYRSLVSDSETLKLFILGEARRIDFKIDSKLLNDLTIELIDIEGKILVTSDPPLEGLFRGRACPTWSFLLNAVHNYAVDLQLGQSFSSDVICGAESAEIADTRIDLSLQRASKTGKRIEAFEEAVFNEAHLFGEAYNEGRLTIGGALNLIDRSRPMREWMRGLPPNADVLREYHQALAKDVSLKDAPASVARFALFSGLTALVSPIVGLGLSAFDTFVVDNVAGGGWRPSFFIKNVREFIPEQDN